MRYLKLFENFKSYYEISEDEFSPVVFSDNLSIVNNWENLTSDELSEVSEYFDFEEKVYFSNGENNWNYYRVVSYDEDDNDNISLRSILCLYKLKDEWFYIEVSGFDEVGGVRRKTFVHYYKCDQWDGLIDCLKMIKNNFIHHTKWSKGD